MRRQPNSQNFSTMTTHLLAAAALLACSSWVNAAPPDVLPKEVSQKPVTAILGMKLATDALKNVVIMDITPDSPVTKIGVEKGDILISFDGHPVSTITDLVEYSARELPLKQPGTEVRLIVVRNRQRQTLAVIVPDRPKPTVDPVRVPVAVVPEPLVEVDNASFLCMRLREADRGVLVVDSVLDRSAAFNAGIQPRDVIVSVGKLKIGSLVKFREAMTLFPVGEKVRLGILRGNTPITVDLTVAPCEPVRAAVPVVKARGPVTPETLAQMRARLKAMQAQIEDLRATAAELSGMIDALAAP